MLWGDVDLVQTLAGAHTVHCRGAAGSPRRAGRTDRIGIVTRLSRATSYPSAAADLIGRVEEVLLTGASSAQRGYGPRKNQLDAYIALARTTTAMTRLAAWLDSGSTAGLPLRQPTRWSIVTHLIERGTPNADALFAAETRHDTTANGKRSAFVAAAGRSSAATKAQYFDRYFRDTTLNEDGPPRAYAFNMADRRADPALPRTGARQPAVDSKERRIFSRIVSGGFIGGHKSPEALEIDNSLGQRPTLPDLRLKILQTA
jgi:aminopeptidase N